MPISAIVDASVLVSAFLFPNSVPGRVLKLAGRRKFAMHLPPLLLDETVYALLSTRLREIYGHTENAVEAWRVGLLDIGSVFAGPLPEIGSVCRDPNDDHVIATALAVNARVMSPATRICWRLANTKRSVSLPLGLSSPNLEVDAQGGDASSTAPAKEIGPSQKTQSDGM